MSESARPYIPEITGEIEGKSEKIYTRDEVIKAHRDGLSLMAASAGRSELRPDQLIDFDISSYGLKNAYKDRFGRPKTGSEYGKVDVVINGDLESNRQFTYKEGPAVEGIINFLGEQIAKTDDPEERKKLQELQRTLLDNSRLHDFIHIGKSYDHKVGRVLAESKFISEDERRNRGNDTDNYYAADDALRRRRELILPSAPKKSNTQTASTNGVVGSLPIVPVNADGGPAAPVKTTSTEYPTPAPESAAMTREASVVKPPAPEIPTTAKKIDSDLPPAPAGKGGEVKLTTDEVAPLKPENLEDEDDLPPSVTSVRDIRKEKAVFKIGNRQRDVERRARQKAKEAVNEQLRSGKWLQRIKVRLTEAYLTEKYTQRLMDAMIKHDNVNVDFDPVKNALRDLQSSGGFQREDAKDEAKAALEHASSGETIEGEVVLKISKTENPKLRDAFLNDIIKPAYDGSIKDEELQKKLAEFIKKNTDAAADPEIRDSLIKVFGSDDKQREKLAQYFATDIIDKINEIKDAGDTLESIDDLIEFELSNVRWGAETEEHRAWNDKVMDWAKNNKVGFVNPLTAGIVASVGTTIALAAKGALRRGANVALPFLGGALVGAGFSAARRNTELKTDRATYLAERAVGGEKKTTAENRGAFRNLINADTMHDMGNFEYDLVDAKDLSYGGGARLLDDEGKFVDDPKKRKERLAIADLIKNNDTAGIADRIAEIQARRDYSALHGVDLIRVESVNLVQRERNLQLDNTLKMLRQELASHPGMTDERIAELTGEAKKKWMSAFDADVKRQDDEFQKYRYKRAAVGAGVAFGTSFIGLGVMAGAKEVLEDTGAGFAISQGLRAAGENLRNLPVAEIGKNAAFNALSPINAPAVRAGLGLLDVARDQVADGVRANLPGIEHGLQFMFDEAPALNAMGELGENALNAAKNELADAGVQFDRFGNAIGENVQVIGNGLNVMADDAPAIGRVREALRDILNVGDASDAIDAAGDSAADATGDAIDQAAGQTEVLGQIPREYVIKNPITEELRDHYDHFTRDVITIGEPGDDLTMHVVNRNVGFYHADGTAFGAAKGIIEADGSLKITGEMPSTLKAVLRDEGFTITDGASRVETILQEVKGSVESPLDGNMTIIPEGTEWRPQGNGTYDLVFSDKPDHVLINDARFDGGGKMIWDHNSSILTDKDINFEEVPVSEPGRSTVNIVNRNGIWATDNVRNVDSVWYTNTEPDAVGNSDLNERSLWLRTDGNAVTLETHLTQDVSFIDANNNDLIDPTDAQINVRNAINENRVGIAFSLPGSENQTIVVQAVNGNLSLRPDSSELVRIWDGTGYNKTMPASELYNALVNQEAVARMPGGYVAGGQDVFKLGVNQDGVIRNGLVRIVVPENNTLNTIATIQSHGAADIVTEIIPGTPTEDLDLITRIDIPDQTKEIPTYDVIPPPDRTVPVDPVPILTTPETPEYTTYIPTVLTPAAERPDDNYLFDSVTAVTPMSPRNPLDPRGGKPDKEKKPGETPDELKEKSPGETPEALTEKAPKEKEIDNLESRAQVIGEGEPRDPSNLPVAEAYLVGRADQDRTIDFKLSNGDRLLAVIDGHGSDEAQEEGKRAADFVREKLPELLEAQLQFNMPIETALKHALLKVDESMILEGKKSGVRYGGATAIATIIRGNEIIAGIVGDSGGFVINADGSKDDLTAKDSSITSDAEKTRLEQAGATIDKKGYIRHPDVIGGGTQTPRSLGDPDWGDIISAEPEMRSVQLTDQSEFFVDGSDGYLNMVPDTPVRIRQILQDNPDASEKEIADALLAIAKANYEAYKVEAISKNEKVIERDDITLQLVDLRRKIKKK